MNPILQLLLGPVLDVITKYIPDPQQKAQAQLALLQLQQSEEFKQLDAQMQIAQGQSNVNAIEAASADKFKSDWRPFIGWVCGVAFAANYVLIPLATWVAGLFGKDVKTPALDMTVMLPVVFGMLGLGYYRTQEKIKGVV